MGVSIDITERKMMEKQLEEAKKTAEKASKSQLEIMAKMNQEVLGASAKEYGVFEKYAHSIRHHLESIIACMPGNVYWIDKNCIYLGCNNNVAKILHLKNPAEVIGLTYDDIARFNRME